MPSLVYTLSSAMPCFSRNPAPPAQSCPSSMSQQSSLTTCLAPSPILSTQRALASRAIPSRPISMDKSEDKVVLRISLSCLFPVPLTFCTLFYLFSVQLSSESVDATVCHCSHATSQSRSSFQMYHRMHSWLQCGNDGTRCR